MRGTNSASISLSQQFHLQSHCYFEHRSPQSHEPLKRDPQLGLPARIRHPHSAPVQTEVLFKTFLKWIGKPIEFWLVG